MYSFEDKVAVITGAGHKGGIGCATAIRLAKGGATIVVVDRAFAPEMLYPAEIAEGWKWLESVVEQIESMGGTASAITADVRDEKEVNRTIGETVERFGKINVLVNNAGDRGRRGVAVVNLGLEDWIKPLDVNLTGSFLFCRAVAKQMIQQGNGGKIVNISSSIGKLGRSGRAAYASSKFGMIGLTQCLAEELGPYNINVNAVCPNAIDSGAQDEDIALRAKRQGIPRDKAVEQFYSYSLSRACIKKVGKPEDVANLIAFLVSDESDYITGQAINVDGGFLMAH